MDQDLAKYIFRKMKKNFIRYLNERVLKELLSCDPKISKAEKIKLLLQVMSLYWGKFRSIWARIVKPGKIKFKNMNQIFFDFQKMISLGIYGSLEYVFDEIILNFRKTTNNNLLISYRNCYITLVEILSNDENENWGLRWIAGHTDPHFILAYFYYQRYFDNIGNRFLGVTSCKLRELKKEFLNVIYFIGEKMNFQFDLGHKGKEVEFAADL
jgi:hypothetical protein